MSVTSLYSRFRDQWRILDRPLLIQVFGLLAVLVSGGTALTFKIDFDSNREREAVQERARVDQRVGVIASRFSDIVSDLRLVSDSGHLHGFFATKAPGELVQLERDLAIFVEAKQIYDQARYIDATIGVRPLFNRVVSGQKNRQFA